MMYWPRVTAECPVVGGGLSPTDGSSWQCNDSNVAVDGEKKGLDKAQVLGQGPTCMLPNIVLLLE